MTRPEPSRLSTQFRQGATPDGQTCAWPECHEAGLHRAPKDRSLSGYQWLCLEHVRAFNAAWNYHQGMSDEDLEREFRSAATWDRPTWPMGYRAPKFHGPFKDPLGFFAEEMEQAKADREDRRGRSGNNLIDAALAVLQLDFPCTLEDVKARYKILVKEFHPDTNGGSPEAEDQMKTINEAYATLKLALT